jgi:hypothetical protein
MAVSILAAGLVLGGCGPAMTRSKISQEDLVKLRSTADERSLEGGRKVLGRLVERTKAEYDRYTAGARKEPPVIDILVISGGGDWGAFGAGFLKGWQKIPGHHPLAKPEFDAVTGVSRGTPRACSTWWRKRSALPIPASLTEFTTSCSPRQESRARFRS